MDLFHNHPDALSEPSQHWNCHTVTQSLVSGAICRWLAAVRDGGVAIWESLKAFAFQRGQSANGHAWSQYSAGAFRCQGICNLSMRLNADLVAALRIAFLAASLEGA